MDRQKLRRDVLKGLLGPWLAWAPLKAPRPGYSIVLGVPWDLRHLLPANLTFVERTDLGDCHRIHIVFDRVAQLGAEDFAAKIAERFAKLPLTFRFHPPLTGRFVRMINQSKFYASMNWTIGIGECETRYALLHDFDLYPLVPNYFSSMFDALEQRRLRFTGMEWTNFDGLEDAHALIGTWALGVDAAWLRANYRPIDCFHAVEYISGRRFDLDAFTFLQSKTPERALVGSVTGDDFAHVRNLCSTYLRFTKGEKFDVVWRLHHMWYLESLCGRSDRLTELVQIMDSASSSQLRVDRTVADFTRTHVTCANVLRNQVHRMEVALFGAPRPEVERYIDAFEGFLSRHGNTRAL